MNLSMPRLEALADALAMLNDYQNPESDSYRLRNPGMLKAKTIQSDGTVNRDTPRQFSCAQGGYKALIDRLRYNCAKYSRATLKDTLAHYGFKTEFELKDALSFIQRSLGNKSVNAGTQLAFFLEQENG